MLDERGVLICDCCARQILPWKCNDKQTVGPKSAAHNIELYKHCCGQCWPDYKQWEEIERSKNWWMF